jgi:hypothetical protein
MWFIPPSEEHLKARDRARELLRSWLSPAQLAEYDEHGYFHVLGERTLTKYRISDACNVFNVKLLREDDSLIRKMCFVCQPIADDSGYCNPLPPADTMLAQKVMLETNEAEALRIANFTNPEP